MKLATALSRRSDLQIKVKELSTRLNNNAKVQDGQDPSEKPEELLVELDTVLEELQDLITRINLCNACTFKGEVSLTELLAKRDILKQRVSILRSFLDTASSKIDRYSRSEIQIHSTIDVAAAQKQVDRYAKELRELEESIQELNWTTEI